MYESTSTTATPAQPEMSGQVATSDGEGMLSVDPWPHLNSYYDFVKRDDQNKNTLHYKCVLCKPKSVTIKANVSSYFNLKSHMNRTHPSVALQFTQQVKKCDFRGKKRSTAVINDSSSSTSRDMLSSTLQKRQATITEVCQLTGNSVPQSVLDEKITDFFVDNMLPMHVVESSTFSSLVETLNPKKKVTMSRRTLGRRIINRHEELETVLIR